MTDHFNAEMLEPCAVLASLSTFLDLMTLKPKCIMTISQTLRVEIDRHENRVEVGVGLSVSSVIWTICGSQSKQSA